MSQQLSCSDTCQIWTWHSTGNQCFGIHEKNPRNNRTKEINSVNPTPGPFPFSCIFHCHFWWNVLYLIVLKRKSTVMGTTVNTGYTLTHWGLVTPCGVRYVGHHWLRSWLVGCLAPSHHLNQCSLTVYRTIMNNGQWSLKQNVFFSIYEIHLKMSSFCWSLNVLNENMW